MHDGSLDRLGNVYREGHGVVVGEGAGGCIPVCQIGEECRLDLPADADYGNGSGRTGEGRAGACT